MVRIAGFFCSDTSLIGNLSIFDEMKLRFDHEQLSINAYPNVNLNVDTLGSLRYYNGSMLSLNRVSERLQPDHLFLSEISIVSESDIFNTSELVQKHDLSLDEDCSVLVRLLQQNISILSGNSDDAVFEHLDNLLRSVRGAYSIALHIGDRIFLARDLIGVKSLWYEDSNGFAFASEKKFLNDLNVEITELDPRNILCYNLTDHTLKFYERPFLSELCENKLSFDDSRAELSNLLRGAVNVRIPYRDFGVMFSAGIDSTILVQLCKEAAEQKGINVTCYTVGLLGSTPSPDIICAKELAKDLGLDLKVREIDIDVVEEYLKVVVPLIEDASVPKTGVALTMYAACVAAKNDGIDVLFAGAGADELFAGYNRSKSSSSVNKDCLNDILNMYEVNTYRDNTVAAFTEIKLRLPYLDEEVVKYSLGIPQEFKISDEMNKIILRRVGVELGLPEYVTSRSKKAAQYGSRFDHALKKLAKRAGFDNKTDYINSFQGDE